MKVAKYNNDKASDMDPGDKCNETRGLADSSLLATLEGNVRSENNTGCNKI